MDIECKKGTHFATIEALKECENGHNGCSQCGKLKPLPSKSKDLFKNVIWPDGKAPY